jgi:hypothetical protein
MGPSEYPLYSSIYRDHWVPGVWSKDVISRSRHTIHTKTASTFSYTPCLSLKLKGTTGVIDWVPGFGWRALSRNQDIQFTRKLLLQFVDVHILLAVHGNLLFRPLHLQNDIRAKQVTCAIFGFLGPYNNYTCHNSMVLRNRSTTKESLRSTLLRYTFLSLYIYFFIYYMFEGANLNEINRRRAGRVGDPPRFLVQLLTLVTLSPGRWGDVLYRNRCVHSGCSRTAVGVPVLPAPLHRQTPIPRCVYVQSVS